MMLIRELKGENGLTEIEKDVTGVVALEGAAKGIMTETDVRFSSSDLSFL